ncbi:amidohydrolase family protein [Roseibium porphyridii]|uniref:Amidohydrolase family protein n=1 Tax=Roseibium porphyridii TaxID=2866279 RepID=A0ABY8EZL6_9HYPH|nr:amidohydrolase family protein [Roseibium sp. KMA01]WFE88613.1 amidohydrolase family protein [Roseibium sp. KMA01]
MIDAHHHIWLQKDLPWLLGPEQPRIFGPYEAIKRDYLVDEFQTDLSGTGITKSVYVQANWAPNWFEDEVAWVQSVADASGWPHGIVGYADFTVEDVRPQLDRLKRYPLMRGLRQQLHWHENSLYRFAARPDLPADPMVQKNIAYLADYGWSFDLQVFPSQMDDAANLAQNCPDVQFVLMHAGMLEDTSQHGIKLWRKGMRRLAECENVATKLSAFGTFIHKNDPEFIAFMIKQSVSLFGAERCMFGSNFPIEKLWTTYGDLFAAFQDGAKGLTKAKRQSIFNDTAERIYRL